MRKESGEHPVIDVCTIPAGSVASGGLPGETELALTECIETPPDLSANRLTYATLLASHMFIDIFPIFFTSLMLVFREKLGLSGLQETAVYMITPIFSGALQPFFAWLTDRFDTRLCGPVGIGIGAVCCASIGFAETFWQLIALQIVGVIGTGMYHPIMTAVAGRLGGEFVRSGRALAIGIFIAAGMLGQSIGPILSTEMNHRFGMERLAWLIVPGVLMVIVLHVLVGKVKHRRADHADHHAALSADERTSRWRLIALLTAQNALRFTTNVAMFVMFNEWASRKVVAAQALLGDGAIVEQVNSKVSAHQALIVGKLSASMTLGMGISVILAGRLFKAGNEKLPLIWMSMLGALLVACIGFVGDTIVPEARVLTMVDGEFVVANPVTLLTLLPMCAIAAASSIGFFATFPISASLAQRLLPAHTSLVTSLMMGVGWAISSISAPIAVLLVRGTFTKDSGMLSPAWRIHLGFGVFASLLVLAGLLAAMMPSRLLHAVRDEA